MEEASTFFDIMGNPETLNPKPQIQIVSGYRLLPSRLPRRAEARPDHGRVLRFGAGRVV